MKKSLFTRLMTMCSLAILAVPLQKAAAAVDDAYNPNDIMLFFQNPTGTVGTDQIALHSLGHTRDVFRAAATPGDPTYGSTIFLGNINTLLTSTYGADWTSLASSIFAGAAGQFGATSPLSSAFTSGDFARTVYITKRRTGAGVLGSPNSSLGTYNPANTGVPSSIAGANSPFIGNQTLSVNIASTTIDEQNPFGPGPTTPALAYSGIPNGVMGAISSTVYSLGSVTNIVIGLDLWRATPLVPPNYSSALHWHNANSISGGTVTDYGTQDTRSDYLGTITLSSDGSIYFLAVPEPSTYALLALAAGVIGVAARRRLNKVS